MKISWVLSDTASFDPEIETDQLKNIGPFWGSWKTWRSCNTDNVICHTLDRADSLIKRNFQEICNFYIPNDNYQILNRPSKVKLYNGDFVNLDLDRQEEIVTMHLAASQSDIILLVGFDWAPAIKNADRLIEHRNQNYRNLVKHAIQHNPKVQWVLIDHSADLMLELKDLPNLTQDTLASVLKMLGS